MLSLRIAGLATRSLEPERMDEEGLDTQLMADALLRVGHFTRTFGGIRSARRLLRRFPGSSVLDVGAGDMALVASLLEVDPNGGPFVGVDAHSDVTDVAARKVGNSPRLAAVRGDGRSLPFGDRSFDLVVSTLTLHHLDEMGATQFLAEMARVARRAVLVWDLERSVLALGGALVLSKTLWRSDPLVSNDGPLSVRRAFTTAELSALCEKAGLSSAIVRSAWPACLELVAVDRGGLPLSGQER